MGPTLDRLFVVIVLGGLSIWVAWGWRSWVRRRPETLSFGMIGSIAGFTFASLSAALEIASGTYAQFKSFPFLDPTLLRIYRVGMLFALLGLLCGLFGMIAKTPLRWKAPALSMVMLLLWLGQAMGE